MEILSRLVGRCTGLGSLWVLEALRTRREQTAIFASPPEVRLGMMKTNRMIVDRVDCLELMLERGRWVCRSAMAKKEKKS